MFLSLIYPISSLLSDALSLLNSNNIFLFPIKYKSPFFSSSDISYPSFINKP